MAPHYTSTISESGDGPQWTTAMNGAYNTVDRDISNHGVATNGYHNSDNYAANNGDPVTSEHSINGNHLTNGHSANGLSNGHSINGLSNGHAANGLTNGHAANGLTNGHSLNGHTATTNGNSVTTSTATGNPPRPMAICGMACRLPRGIKTTQQLWDFLLAGEDARSKVPESRYNVDSFYDPGGKPSTTKTQHGYFLDDNVADLDTSFFSMPRKEVERLDPQQRMMLEVARECFEDSGETEWKGKKIGCYIGVLGEDWMEMLTSDTQNHGIYRVTGYGDFCLSNRISYEMDLQGPSVTVRTACSASMTALHDACVAIERGDCVSAIVGGTNLIIRPSASTIMSEQGVLSPDGSCKTFSAAANGYARGEAIVGVFVKPLEDAIRDRNAIRAVIRATAVNHDGKSAGFTTPSSDAQETLIRRAYEVAGLPVTDTGYFECHGTGTPVGDPIETKAVARVFGEVGITIGSTKPNFGHTEGASGILSVIKAVLTLENATIPPSIKASPRNPDIPWESGKLALAEEPSSWPEGRLKRISVNSFGLGGSNVHAIIDSAANYRAPAETRAAKGESQLFLYSANTQQSLTALIDNYQTFSKEASLNVEDTAYTLARGREHLPYRAFAVASGDTIGVASPIAKPGKGKPTIAMVFTGQGAQWPQMCGHLLKSNSTFQSSIRSLDQYLKDTLGEDAPAWTIEQELLKPKKTSRVGLAEFSQPLCTAIQIGLVDTFRSVGIEADAVVGHSSGEIAAAYATGALTAGEAIVIALYRGIITNMQQKPGAMAALGISAAETKKFLLPNTGIACENSPRSVTISGDADKIEEVLTAIRAANPDVLARKLQVEKAYHSHHMVEIGDDYRALMEQRVVGKTPNKLFFSSVESRLLHENDNLGPRYWQKNLESPVLFRGAVAGLLQYLSNHEVVFLEIGPHSALAGPLTQIMAEENPKSARYIPTIVRNQNSVENVLSAVGKLFTFHYPIDLRALFPDGSCLSGLPPYPYNHSEGNHWFESRISKEYRFQKYPHHDILGVKIGESSDLEPAWRNQLHVAHSAAWLKDHKVGENIVFPFAGYIAMIGEAVRQITNIEEAFELRRISVGSAMLLSEEKPTEIITTLRPLRLTLSQDSSWYEFSISAYNGHRWTKHCSGEVKAEGGSLRAGTSPRPFHRSVEMESWFGGVSRGGLDLGYDFQNVSSITAATATHQSRGIVSSAKHPENPKSKYHIHPAAIDSAIQLLAVASGNGLVRKYKNYLPIYCNKVYVARTTQDFVTDFTMSDMGRSSSSPRVGEGKGVVDGKIVLEFEGLKLNPASITDDASATTDPHAAARLTWMADLDFVDVRTLFSSSSGYESYAPVLEELSKLSILDAQRRLINANVQRSHLKRYAQWINSQATHSHQPLAHGDETAFRKIVSLCDRLANTPVAAIADTLRSMMSSLDHLLDGSVTSWEGLLPTDTVAAFYEVVSKSDSAAFFKILGHQKPNLRVLELGNWARSPSSAVIQALTLPDGRNLWSQYTFASEDSVAAEERLSGYSNLNYVTLDIAGNLADQGFEDDQYDIVIANNALHATSSLAQSLRNVRQLLASDGRLFLQELDPASKWLNVILGTTPEWWRGVGDGRPDEPYVRASRWQHELKAAGFDIFDAAVFDAEESARINSITIARSSNPSVSETTQQISLLVKDKTRKHVAVEKALSDQGFKVSKITLEDTAPPNVDIVSILDLDGPFFENIADKSYHDFQNFLANLKNSGIFWVTRPCHMNVKDPRYAQVIGLSRVIRSELDIDFATCEIDDVDSSFPLVSRAFEKFRIRDDTQALSPDFEFVIDNGIVHIGRFFPFVLTDDGVQTTESERMQVALGNPGRSNMLHWVRQPEPAPLADDQLEIEIHAVGVTFKDVLVSMNLVDPTGRYLGVEGAGIVRRVGAKVADFKPGDRVATMEHNVMTTLLIANEVFCVKIPDSMSFMDAATMFTAYATVQQSFITVGRLQKGDSVLIHSACGGVGLAAIQVAQMIGAEVFATVGSDEKATYLVENHGIPRNRIFNSHDNSFVDGVFRETGGKGVDQVLNSLTGELLHESWKCVAPFGKFIEIGKRELAGHGRLDMAPFMANRSYCCVDIDGFYDVSSSRIKEMMTETVAYFQMGLIKPIATAKVFDAESVADAIKYLQPGTQIGRVGLRVRDAEGRPVSKGEIASLAPKLELDPNASYLLSGGLGGLGRSISLHMVEHGARNLIYLSRRAGQSSGDQTFINELNSMGVNVITVRGDILQLDDVHRAVSLAQYPLKGILHLSTVQADENFARLTKEQWDYSIGPKVNGTWNLHHATADLSLDFFVLFSSISAVVGLPGQANYASGNSFLDAFVQYRNNQGLACSAVNIGPVAEVGMLADKAALLQTAALTGFKTIQEQEMIDAIAASMTVETPSAPSSLATSVTPFAHRNNFVLGLGSNTSLNSPTSRVIWKRSRPMAIFHNTASDDSSNSSGGASADQALKTYLTTTRNSPDAASILSTPAAAEFIAQEIGRRLQALLLKDSSGDVNTSLGLADLGLDSLVAIEMRTWWKQAFGFDIAVLEMLSMGSLEILGRHAADSLKTLWTEESAREG